MITRATINEQIAACVISHWNGLDDLSDECPSVAKFLEAVNPLFERRDELDDPAVMAKRRV